MRFELSVKYQAVTFAFITVAAYGLVLPLTGFYWDDWPFAWIAEFLGPVEFIPAFLPFRPFLGPIFYVTTSLIPPVPVYWQVFALVVRFILGVTAWWCFRQIFPTQDRLALILGLFVLVFPGYSQHWVALTHINQELIPFIFCLLSLGFTFKAVHARKPAAYHILALLFQICGIYPTEYFFGLEGLRFLFLFFHYQGGCAERITRTFRTWMPYLLVWMTNAAWLYYYYRFGSYQSYGMLISEFPFGHVFGQILDALWKAGFLGWAQIIILTLSSLSAPTSLLSLALIVLSFIVIAPALKRIERFEGRVEKRIFIPLLVIGIAGIFLGRLPSLVADLPLRLQTSYDRFMISMAIGGSLLMVGLIEALVKNPRVQTILFAILISLGIGQQFYNANAFRRDWEAQAEIMWEMAWRIPALEPNTVLMTNEIPIDHETDQSFTAIINWMYSPNYSRSNLPYILLYTEKRLGGSTMPDLKPGTEISYSFRTVDFLSSTSNTLVFYKHPQGCLHVMDPSRGDVQLYDNLPAHMLKAIPLSDISRIITDSPSPAEPVFLPEPEHGWCYYHAKAELAHQMGDYQQVVSLGSKAISLGYAPREGNEWLVFIEAYALTGDMKTAQELTGKALALEGQVRRGVCTTWQRILELGPKESAIEILEIIQSLNCAR